MSSKHHLRKRRSNPNPSSNSNSNLKGSQERYEEVYGKETLDDLSVFPSQRETAGDRKKRKIEEEGKKRCIACQEILPLKAFERRPYDNWYRAKCKLCEGEALEDYRKAKKNLCFQHYGGYKCSKCGEKNKNYLVLWRRLPLASLKARIRDSHNYFTWLVTHDFPLSHKLIVLCALCARRRKNKLERKFHIKQSFKHKHSS